MSLSSRLKDSTWASHQSVESRAWQKSLARGAVEPERLGDYLAQLLRVHATLERAVDADPALTSALDWDDSMRHSHRAAGDVVELGARDATELPATTHLLAQIEHAIDEEPIALLGFLYVLEGSMNGNRFLLRSLRRGSAAAHCSFAYFDPYGDDQPARWAAFKQAMDRITLGPEEEAAVIAAALLTFEGMARLSEEMMKPSVGALLGTD